MNETERKNLIEADDPNNVEYPENFHWQKAIQRVHDLKPKVEEILDRDLHIDENVQDATFFTDLMVRHRNETNRNIIDIPLALRFSSFGNLFTVWSNIDFAGINKEVILHTISEVEKGGFNFVSHQSLDEQYTGKNPVFENSTWWLRFFDYV